MLHIYVCNCMSLKRTFVCGETAQTQFDYQQSVHFGAESSAVKTQCDWL